MLYDEAMSPPILSLPLPLLSPGGVQSDNSNQGRSDSVQYQQEYGRMEEEEGCENESLLPFLYASRHRHFSYSIYCSGCAGVKGA